MVILSNAEEPNFQQLQAVITSLTSPSNLPAFQSQPHIADAG